MARADIGVHWPSGLIESVRRSAPPSETIKIVLVRLLSKSRRSRTTLLTQRTKLATISTKHKDDQTLQPQSAKQGVPGVMLLHWVMPAAQLWHFAAGDRLKNN